MDREIEEKLMAIRQWDKKCGGITLDDLIIGRPKYILPRMINGFDNDPFGIGVDDLKKDGENKIEILKRLLPKPTDV